MGDFDILQRQLTAALARGASSSPPRPSASGRTHSFVASLVVTLYLAFFLIRDGDGLARPPRGASAGTRRIKQELVQKFMAVVRATVKGSLLVAGIQGMLGGIAFWFLGVKGALLWAVLMAFLSLLPMVGAGLVWLPVAVFFVLTGAPGRAGAGRLRHLRDRPGRQRAAPDAGGQGRGMPDYVVMITTLGGMAVFGINGFIIGPTIAAMFIAVWHLSITAPPAPAGD